MAEAVETSNETTNAGGTQTVDLGATQGEPTKVVSPEGEGTETENTSADAGDPSTWTFEMPEGVELDQESLTEFQGIAKEVGLDRATADKLIALEAKRMQQMVARHEAQVEAWADEVRNDPELGGTNLEANIATARKVIQGLGVEGLPELLTQTGYGNHPVLVRAFYKLGKLISEDVFVTGQPTSGAETSAAKKMFPTMA